MLAAHGMGKQLKDCDGFMEREKMLENVCAIQKKSPHASQDITKEIFLCAMSRFHMRLRFFIRLKAKVFLCGHQISLKAEQDLSVVKGSGDAEGYFHYQSARSCSSYLC